jgi:hypothetical protein
MAEGFAVNDFEHLEDAQRQSTVEYGIYDTRDDCWLGDDNGPRLFTFEDSKKANGMDTRIMAQIAAQMTEVQLGYSKDGMSGRLRAKEFNLKEVRLKDEMPTQMTALEALVIVEGGKSDEQEIEIRPEDLQ